MAPGALSAVGNLELVLRRSSAQYAPLNVLRNTRPSVKFVRGGILDVYVCVCLGGANNTLDVTSI